MAGEIKAKPETHPEVHAKMESLKKELGKKFDEGEEIYEWYVTHTMCPFQVDNTCSIYEIRPDGCRQFPNTPFGMLSQDCEALNRFKKQRSALKKGRAAKETYHFTTDEPVEPTKCAEEQYQKCVAKLRQAGITDDELALFNCFNTNWNSNLTSNGVEKKKSQINGLGIFATKDFKKGELVIRWSAYKELSEQEVKSLPKEDREHVSFINNVYVLVPPDGWVNHSCDPNVRLENFCYIAKRGIRKGEEITADYREESEIGFQMKCNCGSKNCTGHISVQKRAFGFRGK